MLGTDFLTKERGKLQEDFSSNNVNMFHTCVILSHRFFNSLMTVCMMCSPTPLKKESSAVAVLIVQAEIEEAMAGLLLKHFHFQVVMLRRQWLAFVSA